MQKVKFTSLPVSEDQECFWLVDYLNVLMMQGKVLNYTHVPNSTFTESWSVKVKNKKRGVKKGFPDYIILLHNKAICIEMKTIKGGTVYPEQREWVDQLNTIGVKARICKGYLEAKEFIEENL